MHLWTVLWSHPEATLLRWGAWVQCLSPQKARPITGRNPEETGSSWGAEEGKWLSFSSPSGRDGEEDEEDRWWFWAGVGSPPTSRYEGRTSRYQEGNEILWREAKMWKPQVFRSLLRGSRCYITCLQEVTWANTKDLRKGWTVKERDP